MIRAVRVDHTIGAQIAAATRRLARLSETPRLDAELLFAHALGVDRTWLVTHSDEAAEPCGWAALLERRLQGEPVAYITGYRDFWTLRLKVSSAVLVPRPETELLVELALRRTQEACRVADLGTGSGAIALALASERPGWQIIATDVAADALQVARGNAAQLGLRNVGFALGSWFEPLEQARFGMIVSNPPYIGSSDPALLDPALGHEPQRALTAGADGLASLRELIRGAPPHLEGNGWLLLEHGAAQAREVARELVARGFRHVRSHRDLAGHERVTEGHWI